MIDGTPSLSPIDVLEEEFRQLHPKAQLKPATTEEIAAAKTRGDADRPRRQNLRDAIHSLPDDERRAALCLSGGGIRSATFCLGALQALARLGWLPKFHYLSTVSGGGYIGSWLTSWMQRHPGGMSGVITQLATPAGNPRGEPDPVRRLRAYSNYLSPVWGLSLDFLTLIATFLRNLFLNWLVFVPLLLAVLMLPRLLVAGVDWDDSPLLAKRSMVTAGLVAALIGIAYMLSDLPGPKAHRPKRDHFKTLCLLPLLLAALAIALAWGWYASLGENPVLVWWHYAVIGAVLHVLAIIGGLVARKRWRGADPPQPLRSPRGRLITECIFGTFSGAVGGLIVYLGASELFNAQYLSDYAGQAAYATFVVPLLLGAVWLGTTVQAALTNVTASEDDREWWARSSAWLLAVSAAWILLHALVLLLPWWLLQELGKNADVSGAVIGVSGVVSGIIATVGGYWSKGGLGRLARSAPGVMSFLKEKMLTLVSLAFIVVLLLALSVVTSWALANLPAWLGGVAAGSVLSKDGHEAVFTGAGAELLALLTTLLFCFAVLASYFVRENTFSMQNMYGNRLVRAYLGANRPVRDPHPFMGFDPADNTALNTGVIPAKLFHVVNVALNAVKASGDRLEWQQRKAVPFTFSPLHSGSIETGYRPTNRYTGGVSLGRAFTLSGAAAAPNMGYHSSPLVAFVMALFNVRLGAWAPNPGEAGHAVWQHKEPRLGVRGLLYEALGRTTAHRPYVFLSDGGHFDNLGLYEMVYRRCRDIVVVDAGCDPEYQFEDLENAIRRIRADFGIEITFKDGLPTPDSVHEAQRHYAVGHIDYRAVDGPSAQQGTIIYVKPVLSGDEPLDVTSYATAQRKLGKPFPHQSTSDQFFDESQFESYRALGFHNVFVRGLPEFNTNIWPVVPVPVHPWAAASGRKPQPDARKGTDETAGEQDLARFGKILNSTPFT